MRMFNADGSESEMCGNGIRCVAKYVHDHGIARKTELRIETGAGVLDLQLQLSGGLVEQVRVNMGKPIFGREAIPTRLDGHPPVRAPLDVAGRTLEVTALSMGNPHCVTFVDELSDDWVLRIGPQVEKHEAFPRKVNAEFVQVLSPREVRLRVWERAAARTRHSSPPRLRRRRAE